MNFSRIDISQSATALVDKLQEWLNSFFAMVPNFILAAAVVTVSFVLARFVARFVESGMNKATDMKTLNSLVANIVRTVVVAVGLFAALGLLGLDKTVTSLLAGAGVVGLALAFAFQDIAGNFMSGILLAVRRPFRANDIIETNDFFGTVREINPRSTILALPQGQQVVIPNSSVLQNPVKNYTLTGKRRIDLACGVAYGDDLELAEETAIKAVESLRFLDQDRPVELYFTEFGSSSIDFKVRFWIDFAKQSDFLAARSQAIKTLKTAFDKAGLTIPFPIRTMDFGVVGGVNLNEVLPQKLFAKGHRSRESVGSSN